MNSFETRVRTLVRDTRSIVMPWYGNIESTQKGQDPHNLLTRLYCEVETFLSSGLTRLDPTIGFVGEEFGGDRSQKRFWLCDPIDGTNNYIRGLPYCVTMMALIEDGVTTFSILYDFVNDVVYHAKRNGGAFRDGVPIEVSQRPLRHSYISMEIDLDKKGNHEKFMQVRKYAMVSNVFSSGYECIQVASGKTEARVSCDPNCYDYDIAPGALLIAEAKGIVANVGMRSYDHRNLNVIAANPLVFKELTEGDNAPFPIVEEVK